MVIGSASLGYSLSLSLPIAIATAVARVILIGLLRTALVKQSTDGAHMLKKRLGTHINAMTAHAAAYVQNPLSEVFRNNSAVLGFLLYRPIKPVVV